MSDDQSYQGFLLAASPHLPDSNFTRTVVLMLQHDDDGALGVVLNRPSENTIEEIWRQVAEEECPIDGPLFLGGPLAGPLIAVHTVEELSQSQVAPGVYFAMQRDQLTQLIGEGRQPLRLFSGYSGWGKGQLEQELAAGAWLATPAASDVIFADHDDLWKKVIKGISDDILFTSLDLPRRPQDPNLN